MSTRECMFFTGSYIWYTIVEIATIALLGFYNESKDAYIELYGVLLTWALINLCYVIAILTPCIQNNKAFGCKSWICFILWIIGVMLSNLKDTTHSTFGIILLVLFIVHTLAFFIMCLWGGSVIHYSNNKVGDVSIHMHQMEIA